MLSIVVLATLLSLPGENFAQNPSPCPEILTYESRDDAQGRWYAKISLTSNEDLNGVWLRIILDRNAEILGNWFGDSSTQDNKEYLIKNSGQTLRAHGDPLTIKFFIKYSLASVIPSVTSIRLNGKTICPTKQTATTSTTTERQLHLSQLHPDSTQGGTTTGGSSNNHNTNNNNNNNDYGNNNHNNNNRRTTTTSAPSHQSQGNHGSSGNSHGLSVTDEEDDFFPGDFSASRRPLTELVASGGQNNDEQCGTVRMSAQPLITYGQASAEGQWPWHGALYRFRGTDLTYICGASLISKNHAITAAHCVTKSRTGIVSDPEVYLLYLGKHNLHKLGSRVQDIHISKIIVHPNYNATYYHNDIAILKFERPAEVTDSVRPVCLWEENTSLNEVVGKQGTVIGWGFDQTGKISPTLMHARMPVVSTETCIFSNRDFFSRFTSSSSFCAGFRNGTSACTGDSGGSMVFAKEGTSGSRTVWQIRGVISVSAALQNDELLCDTNNYVVFSDVAKHLDWIKSVMNRN